MSLSCVYRVVDVRLACVYREGSIVPFWNHTRFVWDPEVNVTLFENWTAVLQQDVDFKKCSAPCRKNRDTTSALHSCIRTDCASSVRTAVTRV